MKLTFTYLMTVLLILGCGQATNQDVNQKVSTSKIDTGITTKSADNKDSFFQTNFFTESDALAILGESGHLIDSSSKIKEDTLEYRSAYEANSIDQKSGKKGIVYFMIEQYSTISSAQNAYKSIKTANEKHEGVKVLAGLGDEAYFHSDGQNFYFVLLRKEKKMFRIKLNKITNNTTLVNFNLIAKKVAATL